MLNHFMDRTSLRHLQTLNYHDPEPFLVRLRAIEVEVSRSDLPYKVRSLRTNELKAMRELREAAIFCYGIGKRIGQTVYLAADESQDYDFIASWVVGDIKHFAPVQLKEIVPTTLNPNASLAGVVAGLAKYSDSKDLSVVIHLNQETCFDPATLVVPSLNIAALWVFAAITPDQTSWGIWGNFLEEPEGTRFEYPV